MAADSAVPEVPLRALLPCLHCGVRLRIKERHDSGSDDSVYASALSGAILMEHLKRSHILDGQLLLDAAARVTTDGDGTLVLTVQIPDPKPKPESADVDYAAELKELIAAVREYNYDRDAEWDFADKHGVDASGWTDEQVEEHDQILADIARNRKHIQEILRRVTGDVALEF